MTALTFESAKTRAPPQTKPDRDYLSFSAIRTYQQCPLRYFFRYIAGLPDSAISASLVFGSAIHRALEHHFRRLLEGQQAPGIEALLAEYQEEWKEQSTPVRFGTGDDAASFDNLAERMLTAFAGSDLAKPQGHILAVEETLRGNVIPGLPEILGRVDLILETRDELVISDWKTSRAKYSQDQVADSNEQLLLYSELARDFAPGKKIRLEFAVLTKTKEVQIDRHSSPVDPLRVDRTKRIFERVWNAIEGEVFYPAPSIMNCPGCSFRAPCQKWPA